MYISRVLLLLSSSSLLTCVCVSGTGLESQTVDHFRDKIWTRHCPGQIVTGPQNSIHCDNVKYIEDRTQRVIRSARYTGSSGGVLQRCQRDLERMADSVDEEWAMKMLDAAGKPSSGLLEGNVVWEGDYFECLHTSAPKTSNATAFNGQYCYLNYDLKIKGMTLPLSIGLCFPDTCDEDSLANLTHITKKLAPTPFGPMRMTGIFCKPRTIPWDAPAIVMLTIISIFVALSVTGTLMTLYERYFPDRTQTDQVESQSDQAENDQHADVSVDEVVNTITELDVEHKENLSNGRREKLMKVLKCFCVLTNCSKILDTSSKAEFRCVHGIRFFSMSWIMLGHTFSFVQSSGLSLGIVEFLRRADTLAFEGIMHGTFAVDTFFLLSGFLLTYLFLREADKKDGQISWGLYYFHRYWRLTPVYAIVLGFNYTLVKYLGDGPFWSSGGNEPFCTETWWWNLLYINNFTDKWCMVWTWFLANDMQFYVISPFILYPLWRKPKIGLSLTCVLMLVSWICAITISWHYEFLAGSSGLFVIKDLPKFMKRMEHYFQKFSIKPYVRIGPYLIGVILGHVLHKEKDRKRHLSTKAQAIGWCVAAVVALTMVFGMHHVDTGVALAAFYNGLAPTLFTASLAWVIFSCVTQNGEFVGVVNKILSIELLVPLSRLTYCAYLVHPIIMTGFYQSLEKSMQVTFTVTTTLFLGFLIMSYMAAFVTSLLFEAPFMALEKMFIKRK